MEEKIIENLCDKIEKRNPKVEKVKRELEKISNRGRIKWGKCSPLVSAVHAKRKDLIKLMIEDFGFDVDSSCEMRPASALLVAIVTSDEDMTRFLVVEMKAKVNINYHNSFWKATPLIFAIWNSKLQMVKLLVEEFGADVNFKASTNKDGSNPFLALHMAIYNKKE